MASKKEAPRVESGTPRETCRLAGLHSRDTNIPGNPQVADLEAIDACLEAAEAYERVLAAKQFRLRKCILNLRVYHDNVAELGDVVWKGARP